MKRSFAIALFTLSLFFGLSAGSANAVQNLTPPAFSFCPAPGGTIIASYTDGTHGVPGNVTSYSGSDTVFQLNESQVVQCLCPPNSQGIQTWWWKVGEVSDETRNQLAAQGWVFVPNGKLWGLSDSAYFAKNTAYSCAGTGGGDNGGNGGNGSSSSSNSSGDSGVGGVTNNNPGQVLGAYAATGSSEQIFLFAGAAIALLALSWILQRATR